MDNVRTCTCQPGCTIPYGTCHCGCGQATTIAPQTRAAYGHVRGEPMMFIRGHAGRKPVHELTEIDETLRTAVCALCGPTTIRIHSHTSQGKTQWRCLGRVVTEHNITEIDENARTAFCRGCGRTVPIVKNPKRTKGWVCGVKLRADQDAYRKANPEKVAAGIAAWREANPDYRRNHHFTSKYGITAEQRDQMAAERGNLCDICQLEPSGKGQNAILHADHDHKTRALRGMLEQNCNTGLGAFKDDVARLARAIVYLKPGPVKLRLIAEYLTGEAQALEDAQARAEVG